MGYFVPFHARIIILVRAVWSAVLTKWQKLVPIQILVLTHGLNMIALIMFMTFGISKLTGQSGISLGT